VCKFWFAGIITYLTKQKKIKARASILLHRDTAMATLASLPVDVIETFDESDYLALALTCRALRDAVFECVRGRLRTRVATALACNVKRLEWGVALGAPVKRLCEDAASFANYAVMVRARELGAEWGPEVSMRAARAGHLRFVLRQMPHELVKSETLEMAIASASMAELVWAMLHAPEVSVARQIARVLMSNKDPAGSIRAGVWYALIKALQTRNAFLITYILNGLCKLLDNTLEFLFKLPQVPLELVDPIIEVMQRHQNDGGIQELCCHAISRIGLSTPDAFQGFGNRIVANCVVAMIDYPLRKKLTFYALSSLALSDKALVIPVLRHVINAMHRHRDIAFVQAAACYLFSKIRYCPAHVHKDIENAMRRFPQCDKLREYGRVCLVAGE
jgi:hypothetical protein